MFQILQDTHFDFLGTRRIWLTISATAVALSLILLATRGLNYGIEFTGGAEVQVQYAQRPDVGAIRGSLGAAGLDGTIVTTIGELEDHEIYIRLPLTRDGDEADVSLRIVQALQSDDTRQKIASGLLNLNTADAPSLAAFFSTVEGLGSDAASTLAEAVVDRRSEQGLFSAVDQVRSLPGMTDAAASLLEARAFAGAFAVRSQSYIGPVIGRELVRKALWAILGSLLGILTYIWIRFEFQWGLAAVIALVHDTLVTLGLFSLLQFELSLPVVASFLTLIGYSVNDTVVIFDRVRENLRTRSGPTDYEELLNASVNQTLSRTIITSLLTWFVCLALFLFGGEILRGFSFVLVVGVIVGSYSTIYIASPVLLAWRHWVQSRKASKGAGVDTGSKSKARPVARKVRSSGKS